MIMKDTKHDQKRTARSKSENPRPRPGKRHIDLHQRMYLFAAAILEWRYSELVDRSTPSNEMHGKRSDIDMNVWDITRNIIELISFHQFCPFHLQSDLTI
jgi:hypothetical protein